MTNVWSEAAALSQIAYSDKESLDTVAGTMQGSVRLMCAWADRYTILNDILGNSKVWPLNGASTAVASKASAIGVPSTQYTTVDGAIAYEQAFLDIQYSNFDPEIASGAEDSLAVPGLKYVDSIEPTVEFLTLDFNKFRWNGGDRLEEKEAPARQLRGLALARTIYGLTAIPNDLLSLPGKVNQNGYVSTPLGLTFAIGTLLFTPPSISINVKTDGTKERTATLKLLYKAETWNKFWRAKTQSYENMQIFDGGAWVNYENYPTADMSNWLFN